MISVQSLSLGRSVSRIGAVSPSRLPFYLLAAYLFFEYGRPQSSLEGLETLHLPAVISVLVAISLVFVNRLSFSDTCTRLFLVLLSFMIFQIPVAVNNYWAFQIAKGMTLTFIAYLAIVHHIDSFELFKKLIYVWLGIHTYLAVNGIMMGGKGIGGFLGDENDFCMTLNMIIPFSFFMFFAETHRVKKVIYMALTVLFLLTIVLTFSRGGFIGLVAVGLYCWYRSPKKTLSAIVVALLIVVMLQWAPRGYWEEIKTIQKGTEDATGADRIYLWRIGWAMFLDNPVLGVGQGSFPFAFRKYEIETGNHDGFEDRSRAGMVAHSIYFTVLGELGLIGTAVFLAFLYHILKKINFVPNVMAVKRKYPLGAEGRELFYLSLALQGNLIGFLVSGVFISVLYYPNFWILTGMVVALNKIARKAHLKGLASPPPLAEPDGTSPLPLASARWIDTHGRGKPENHAFQAWMNGPS